MNIYNVIILSFKESADIVNAIHYKWQYSFGLLLKQHND
jgi:hypothetical protein